MNITMIVQFLVLLGEAKTQEQVDAQLEGLVSSYGFDFYSVLIQPLPQLKLQRSVLAAQWPENWTELYAQRKYSLIDPTLRWLRAAQRPFRWKEALLTLKADPHRQRMKRMMQEAGRHGLHDGYVFPIHGRNGLVGSFAIGGQPVDLSPAELNLFDAAAKAVFWKLLELRHQADIFENIPLSDLQLTRREMEVTLLLANGLTSNEIAKELDISSHTVDWYINGLHEKFGANNRQHLIALAFRLALIA
ncbi:helix-turn-helix transcriptional regulator [Aliirhizobium smilacinae]|uniref:LuxR family transcriptional regulator n=1 Tax=Aliirhizobium smilacinae TaxID=1395944 RepID=A0A5C4XCB9_9HYPH|nr:LuxR family transcriptional regulator [Rhizobium smilacinae]TNM60939.1 LuxR family transcriptional regulator [Rhizobium smilacinae]